MKLPAAAAAGALLLLASCRPDGVDGEVLMPLMDIATFEGNNAPGGCARFTVVRDGDEPAATLDASVALGEGWDAPQRVLIRYTIPSNLPYTSGQVALRGIAQVNQGTPEGLRPGEEWWADPVYVYSIWRTGGYLNFHVGLPYCEQPRRFCVAADPATADGPVADLYLVHILPEGAPVSHDRSYYASYDISRIWASVSEGVRVHVANSNLDKQIFTFSKTPGGTE